MNTSRPTKEFFESDPIAADIRNLTLEGVAGCLHRLLGRDGWDGKIMESSAKLQKLGVTAGMHLIESDNPEVITREQRALMASPRKAAEFVGGMFLGYLYTFDGALEMPGPSTIAFTRMLSEGEIPYEVRMANADMSSLTIMEQMLDRQPEEFWGYP